MPTSRTTRLLTAPIALALAVGLGPTAPANASSTTRKDPRNDVFVGSLGGGIDLAAVQLEVNRTENIRVTFRLYSPVMTKASLERPGGGVHQERADQPHGQDLHEGRHPAQRGLQRVHRRGSGGPYNCSKLPVTQVDAKTYSAVVNLKQVKKGAKVLQWTALSMDLSSRSPVMDSMTAMNRKPFRWRL
ncbi:hypothetical protein [Nocardioides piscis]|uniref:Uncharacterized protein n=1 Tax=Nocardioides piscis TaxID=2714938 RepID=A0A6G7YGB9_9ACTN|nr:hypothetical protein [Nocardioides piscis]QIK75944.1 hypothetical protein G7071_11315 [Nocardioides piscis]